MTWLWFLLLAGCAAKALNFVNVTEETGLLKLSGDFLLAAFADFNSDKSTDLLLLNRTGGSGCDDLSDSIAVILASSCVDLENTLAVVPWDNGKFGDVNTLMQ